MRTAPSPARPPRRALVGAMAALLMLVPAATLLAPDSASAQTATGSGGTMGTTHAGTATSTGGPVHPTTPTTTPAPTTDATCSTTYSASSPSGTVSPTGCPSPTPGITSHGPNEQCYETAHPTSPGATGTVYPVPCQTPSPTPTREPNPLYPGAELCHAAPAETDPPVDVRIDSPRDRDNVTGRVTITGETTRRWGSGSIVTDVIIRDFADNYIGTIEGEGPWSIQWYSADFVDARYELRAAARVEDRVVYDTLCIHTMNGVTHRAVNHFLSAEPLHVRRGDEIAFPLFIEGDATRPVDIATLDYRIDGGDSTILTVAVRNHALSTGAYRFEINDVYNRIVDQHDGWHNVELWYKLDPGTDKAWNGPGPQTTLFRVESGGTGTPTTGPPPTASPTPEPTVVVDPASAWVDPSGLGFSTVRPVVGEEITVYVRVTNPTDAVATGRVHAEAAPTGRPAEWVHDEYVELRPDESRVLTLPWTPTSDGEHRVDARFDSDSPAMGLGGAHALLHVGEGASTTPTLVLSAGLVNIGTLPEGSTRTVPVEVTAYNQFIPAVNLVALDNAGLRVRSLTPPTDIAQGQTMRFFLQIEVPELGANQTVGADTLLILARSGQASSNVEILNVVVHDPDFAGLPFAGVVATLAALTAGAGTVARLRPRP